MDPFSLVIIPMLVTMTTPQFNLTSLAWNSVVKKIKGDPKAINHDLQKAIKIAYLKALIEIAENITGQIQSFRLHQPGKLQEKIKEWRAEIKILPGLEDIAEIKPPVQNTEEIEQLLFSHGELTENIQELESRLVGEALANMADLPAEYQEQVKTGLFQRFYDHFVEQLKVNQRAFQAFQLDYLLKINQSLKEVATGQVEIVLTMQDLFGQFAQSLEDLRRDTAEILSRLDPQNPQLTDEEWQVMAGLMLAEQRALSSNLFSSADGLQLNSIDVYVPLGLEERKQQKKVKGDFSPEQFGQNIQEQDKKEQEQVTITPISEDQFFQDVLQQGKSPTSQGKRLAVIGEAGAGKTTRLQIIADFILEEKLGLPIWVPLGRLTGGLDDYLQRWLNDATGQNNLLSDFKAQFQAGKVWLLLDGLDEMTDRITADHGDLLQGWWSQARFVVTCRVNVWDNYRKSFDKFDVYRNLDFQLDQVQLFINKFFQKLEKSEAGEELWSRLQGENHERLRDLVHNPLRLFLLCWAWEQGERNLPKTQADLYERNLPETQAGLYELLVKQLYIWKSDVIRTTEKERQLIQEKLSELALMAINGKDQQGRSIPRFWFRESLLEQVFRAVDDPICKLALRVGLINQLGQTAEAPIEKAYGFYHATFQEYFAALGVADWDYFLPRSHVNFPVKDRQYRIFASEWEQVILLWLGRGDIRDEVKEEFIEKLVSFDDGCGEWNFNKVDRGFYEYQAYFLAGLGINEFKTCSQVDQIIEKIIKSGFGYFNPEKQEWQGFFYPIPEGATKVLPRTLREKVINGLIQVLESTDNDDTRTRVAQSLGKIDPGNELAIGELIRVLESTDNYLIRCWWVLESLGKIAVGNELAISKLICVLESTDNDLTSRNVVQSLGKIAVGNELAISALTSILETTDNGLTRARVAQSLGEIAVGNELAISKLIHILETTDNDDTRSKVAYSLGEIAVGNELAIGELIRILESTDNDDTRRWVACLEKIAVGNELAISELIRILESTDNDDTRRRVAYILGEIAVGNELAIGELIRILESTDNDDTRRRVAYSLGKIAVGNELAISELIRILESTDNDDTRRRVAQSLGRIDPGNELAIGELIRILEFTDNDDICLRVAYSLGKTDPGNELAIGELIHILESTDNDDTRRWVAYCLSEIDPGNELAIGELIRILESTDNDDTRRWVAYCLRKIDSGNELVIGALIRVLESTNNYDTRWEVLESLGDIIAVGNEFAISELIRILESTYYRDIRRWVAQRLGDIAVGNELAISKLIRILESTDNDDTRRWVAQSLGDIAVGNELAISKLIRILESTDNNDTCIRVLESLWEIAVGNELAISELIHILESTDNDDTRRWVANILVNIAVGNELAISELIRILETTDNNDTREKTINVLNKIITTNEHRKILVNKLQRYLNNETYENNFDLFGKSYETLWNIAQNLTYPEFYQAWHNNPSPLNLAQLPQLLQDQIKNHNLTETHQIFLIDGSKFIDRDNPSLDIYEQLLEQQCQPRPNGEPENLSQLKSYWGQIRRNSDKKTILIFYENPTPPIPQGFSPKFINTLSRFEGAIALIDDNIQSDQIKTFTSQDPNLLQNIIDWLKNITA